MASRPLPRLLPWWRARIGAPDAHLVCTVAGLFVLSRLVQFLIIFCSSIILPNARGHDYALPGNLIASGLLHWDAWNYVHIATQGYSFRVHAGGLPAWTAFFPLYPMLIHGAAGAVGNPFVAALLISNGCLLGGLAACYALARCDYDRATAGRALLYLSFAPAAVFFTAAYTESLYLLLLALTLLCARRGIWWGAAIAGALAAATKNIGVLLALAVALEALQQRQVRLWPAGSSPGAAVSGLLGQRQRVLAAWPGLLAAACVPLGLLAYMAYLGHTYGDPLGFLHAQEAFQHTPGGRSLLDSLTGAVRRLQLGPNVWAGEFSLSSLLDLLAVLGCAPLVLLVARRMRGSYGVYTLLAYLAPLSTGTPGSMLRYSLLLLPCVLLLADWGRRVWVDRAVLLVSLPLMALVTVTFSHSYMPF